MNPTFPQDLTVGCGCDQANCAAAVTLHRTRAGTLEVRTMDRDGRRTVVTLAVEDLNAVRAWLEDAQYLAAGLTYGKPNLVGVA
jgi:hypothetical protein